MRTDRIVGPDGLEADAVVPQCLDNQYLTDEVYEFMTERGLDYIDDQVQDLRSKAFNTEFLRSVIYSSQVVAQRAALRNNEFLRQHFSDGGHGRKNFAAFANLVRNKTIVPYLFTESSLADSVDFDVRNDSDRLLQRLIDEVGEDMVCVRLAVEDDANRKRTSDMATAFGAGIAKLDFMDMEQRSTLAADLFKEPSILHNEGQFDRYLRALDDLTDRARKRARISDGRVSRNDLYGELFCAPGTSVADGRLLRRDNDGPFGFELKKYVDLVYNTNLPDRLKRYTFTPAGLPSRLALSDDAGTEYSFETVRELLSNDELIESVRRTFMARVQQPMHLPILRELHITDVEEIRALPEWTAFRDGQTRALMEPLRITENLENFQASFNEFQRAFSAWYIQRYGRARTEARYCNFVSLALSLAGRVVISGSHLGGVERVTAGFAADQLVSNIPTRVKGFAAKLMVQVYDIGRRRIDHDRSYSIELMQSDVELARDDIVELLRAVESRDAEAALPNAAKHSADQGIL